MDTFYIVLKQLYIYRCLNGQKQRVTLETCDLFDSSYEKNNLPNILAILATFEFFTMYLNICICAAQWSVALLSSLAEAAGRWQLEPGLKHDLSHFFSGAESGWWSKNNWIIWKIFLKYSYDRSVQMSLWQYDNLLGQYDAAYRRRNSTVECHF